MGQAIQQIDFTVDEQREFKRRLREETKTLMRQLEQRAFEYSDIPNIGLEVEAWLMDKNYRPTPQNEEFLGACHSDLVVEELSQFNFELNTDPEKLKGPCFKSVHDSLKKTWSLCHSVSDQKNLLPLLVGIHPLIRDEHLQLEWMSKGDRYLALNNQVNALREGRPTKFDIKGYDHFQMSSANIMPEAAATSIQVHLQANQENFRRLFNASQIVATPCVALAANSPFLYGHDLWDETRIPLFEQALSHVSFRDKRGRGIERVTFGTGYIRYSPLELFIENLDGFEPLIPVLFDEPAEKYSHLKLHNGTLWRWNRPIIGHNKMGEPHLRIEHRVMASGPTLTDIVANMAFYLGLTTHMASLEKVPEESMTFTDCRNNFYAAAKSGLNAKIRWFGKRMNLCDIILNSLLPMAKLGLQSMGVDKAEIEYYLDDVIYNRVLKGQNGAKWQRSFVEIYGKDFQALTERYFENQVEGDPVYKWKI